VRTKSEGSAASKVCEMRSKSERTAAPDDVASIC
jgi:hypothetical protein